MKKEKGEVEVRGKRGVRVKRGGRRIKGDEEC
jgi:hypothetical protein